MLLVLASLFGYAGGGIEAPAQQAPRGDDAGSRRARQAHESAGQSLAYFQEKAAQEFGEKLAVVAAHIKKAKRPQKRDVELASAKRAIAELPKPQLAPQVDVALAKLVSLVSEASDLTGVMMALAQIEAIKQAADRVRVRRRREEEFIAAFLAKVA